MNTQLLKQQLYQKCIETLKLNHKYGQALNRNNTKYEYFCPSKGHYDQQWLWDSSFHAITLSHYDIEKAKQEIYSLLSGMKENGFMPNVIMWDHPNSIINKLFATILFNGQTSNISQPPVIAISVEKIFDKSHDIKFLQDVLPNVSKFYDWLGAVRDPDEDFLVSVIHPWETGVDSTPSFDSLLNLKGDKPSGISIYLRFYRLLLKYSQVGWDLNEIFKNEWFDVEHVMFNCIYAQGLRSLGRLYMQIGDFESSEKYHKLSDKVEDAIISSCWNKEDELFYDLKPANKQIQVPTISSLFPIILDRIPKEMLEKLIQRHLLNADEFWTAYPLPSVPKNHPTFNTKGNQFVLWRGPTWINVNWFIAKGLLKHGYEDISNELATKTLLMMSQNTDIYEYYNPETGEGEGQKHFGWSTLIIDLFDQVE